MKKILLLIAVGMMSSLSFGQNAQKAKQLLDEVSAKIASYDNMIIDFKHVLNNTEADVRQETRGDVTLQGEKYLLNTMGITQIFDGKKTYTIVPENEEVNITDADDEDTATITPSKMLSFYKDGYSYAWDILQNVKGRKIQYVKLTPIDVNSEVKSVLLGIDVTTKHIYNLIETGKNGTMTTLTVNSFKTNQPLSKTLFTFDASKYDGYYINN
ncbi:outer membrane lipoprotein carrier protein LolA [Sungkyunkwania multivorans]|uniref:Outer membrane lipoprotein carrier protein LolA n=1 Tax=Sungkyunkwania multivorans TaxID=1173618 RepID=A0ABW3CUL2_9FLAO